MATGTLLLLFYFLSFYFLSFFIFFLLLLFVCLSVCPIYRPLQQQQHDARRSAENASSVVLSADVGS